MMKSSVFIGWKLRSMVIMMGFFAVSTVMSSYAKAANLLPAYHLISVTEEGINSQYSHDGIKWKSFAYEGLSTDDCYDMALSPDGSQYFLAYHHKNKNGKHTLNVLQTTDSKHLESAAILTIPKTISCGQPQMRHLHGNLYGILWLDEGNLYSAIYDASKHDSDKLTLSKPIKNSWFTLVEISELSFAYHNGSIFAVWSPNSKDRIMVIQGEIIDNKINYSEPDYHLENHKSISNVISEGEQMAIVVVTGGRINRLMTSPDGSYWDKGPSCFNLNNIPFSIPFLYKDASGEKIYLRSNDYAGTINTLQRFSDCEEKDIELPTDAIRIEYFPGH